jgi:hypothetical protein
VSSSDDLLNRSAQLVEGVASATGWAPAMLVIGLVLVVALWLLYIGTLRES